MRSLCLLPLAALAACSSPERSGADNIVLIVMDTVRVDHLSAYGYHRPTSPFLEDLAAQGTRYERAWSTSSWTLPSHASMFTGLLPSEHGATQSHLHLVGEPAILAEQLAEAGYQTAAFSNNPWVSEKTGLERGFDHFSELWRKKERPRVIISDPSAVAVERWLDAERDPARPFFLFVNLMEAHGPYEPDWRAAWSMLGPLESARAGSAYGAYDELGLVRSWYTGEEPVDTAAIEAAVDLYDAEILQLDGIVERIVGAVDRCADPASTTLMVVSDHGESFGEHGHVGHAFQIYDTLLRIAAIARGPGFEGGRVEPGVVQITDVYPTLLAAAGLEPPAGPGRDLRAPGDQERMITASYAYPEQVLRTFPTALRSSPRLEPHLRSFHVGLDGRHKLILDSNGHEELYDLELDPGESEILAGLEPGLLERLRALAMASAGQLGSGSGGAIPVLDPETEQALRELGYVE
jgi:arylsulfatase A-like enzyme